MADRIVQASLKLVLEPIFEADFHPSSYGFRPRRRAQDAIAEIHKFTSRPADYEWVFEADTRKIILRDSADVWTDFRGTVLRTTANYGARMRGNTTRRRVFPSE